MNTRREFEWLSFDDLKYVPPASWLIDTILVVASFVVLFGAPGSLKTFLALDLALCIATGRRFLRSFAVRRRGPVLYVAAEGITGMRNRVEAWKRARKWTKDIEIYFLSCEVDLCNKDSVRRFLKSITALGIEPVFIVFDTVARCTPGRDENSSRDMGLLVQNVTWIIRQTGAAVCLIHHSTRGTKHERGSTTFEGAADTRMFLRRGTGKSKHQLTITNPKMKYAEEFEDIHPRAKVITLDDDTTSLMLLPGEVKTKKDDSEAPLSKNAATALKTLRKGMTYGAWRTASRLTKPTFNRHRDALVERGLVIKTGNTYGRA